MRVPMLAGITRIDRSRGSGWLDCPNCDEHALQDVIDDMRFVGMLFYRLAPVHRRRDLLCRNCGFRREARAAEMRTLNTAGRPIRRAWFVPFGLIGVALTAAFAQAVAGGTASAVDTRVTFVPALGMPIAPVQFERPATWSVASVPDADPPYIEYQDGQTGAQSFKIARIPTATTAGDVLREHYRDESGITGTCFPTAPPKGTVARLAGQDALVVTIDYRTGGGSAARLLMWSLVHDDVGYAVTYVGATADGIATLPALAERVNRTIAFTSATEDHTGPAPGGDVGGTPTPSGEPASTDAGAASGCSG
jgi:hypothetical protein